ncbi:MAG: class I SAM-dependent methyltransferase [Opitutaceae bacterium]
MRCLNSPPILNSLEAKMVEAIPAEARHVLVVNAGDGRLARAVKEKLSDAATVSVVTLEPGLMRFVEDFVSRTDRPWAVDWQAGQVAAHGPFDCVVLYQLHEFWRGELYQFQQLLRLAKPGALIWTSFLNAQANRMIARFLPPVRLGLSVLADPLRCAPNLDLASYLDFVVKMGGELAELWGVLDQNAQDYCQKKPDKPVQWEMRGIKVMIGTYADAFLWGASIVGVAFRTRGGAGKPPVPNISFSPYNASLMQALVLPYPAIQTSEGALAIAQLQIDSWRQAPPEKVGGLTRFLLEQLGGADQPKRVLVVGSGWGRDLLLLKRSYPAWEWVGFDHTPELVALGSDLALAAGAKVVSGEIDSPLPFSDGEFDLVVSHGYFSTLYEPAARLLAKEVRRVTRGPIYHLEDGRGPDQSLQLKNYSLKAVYSDLGHDSTIQPVLIDGSPSGMYLLKVGPIA